MVVSRRKNKWELHGEDARDLYVDRGLSVPAIAKLLPVSKKTLYRWRNDDGWVDKRKNFQATDEHAVKQLKDAYVELALALKKTNLTEKVTIADALSKIGKAMDRFKQKRDVLRETLSALNRFKGFLEEKEDTETLELLSRRINEFGEHQIRMEI